MQEAPAVCRMIDVRSRERLQKSVDVDNGAVMNGRALAFFEACWADVALCGGAKQ